MNWDHALSLSLLHRSGGYRHTIAARPCEIADFLAPSAEHDTVIAERRSIIAEQSQRCLLRSADCEPLLRAATQLIGDSTATLADWARDQEADLLVLDRDSKLRAGAICFPSGWAPERVLGQPLRAIHEVVPALNRERGDSIDGLLGKLRPGRALWRSNWGLRAHDERDDHPRCERPRLSRHVDPQRVWLRREFQLLAALPDDSGVLFGIRLAITPLEQVIDDRQAATGLRQQLATLEPALLRYKGLDEALPELLALLD